jgi:hypothetical protein
MPIRRIFISGLFIRSGGGDGVPGAVAAARNTHLRRAAELTCYKSHKAWFRNTSAENTWFWKSGCYY